MKKVLLRFFSANNLGDDLFVKIITDRYKNTFTALVDYENVTLNRITNLRTIRKPKVYYLYYKVLSRLTRKGRIWIDKELRHNDLYIYIGGSIFQQGPSIKPWLRELRFYERCKKPYYILGSNVGPFTNKSAFVPILKKIFKGAQDVCFRDIESYRYFDKLANVRVASDIVFTLKTDELKLENNSTVVFSIIDSYKRFGNLVGEAYEKMIAEMTAKFIREGKRVVYLSFWKDDGDLSASESIINKLDETTKQQVRIYSYDGDIEEALQLIASCNFVVASRFHATILALLLGKRVLPIAYSNKTLNILKDLGYTGPVIDMSNLNLTTDLKDIEIDKIMPFKGIDKQRKLAEKQFKELDKLLVRRKAR